MKATLGISLLNIGLVMSSLIAQLVRNPSAMQETWVRSLGWEDALEKGKATHSSILAWRILWTVYCPWGRKESDTTEPLSLFWGHGVFCLRGKFQTHVFKMCLFLN